MTCLALQDVRCLDVSMTTCQEGTLVKKVRYRYFGRPGLRKHTILV